MRALATDELPGAGAYETKFAPVEPTRGACPDRTSGFYTDSMTSTCLFMTVRDQPPVPVDEQMRAFIVSRPLSSISSV